jgi:hypothetical protein
VTQQEVEITLCRDDGQIFVVKKFWLDFRQIYLTGQYEGQKLRWLEAHGKRVIFE